MDFVLNRVWRHHWAPHLPPTPSHKQHHCRAFRNNIAATIRVEQGSLRRMSNTQQLCFTVNTAYMYIHVVPCRTSTTYRDYLPLTDCFKNHNKLLHWKGKAISRNVTTSLGWIFIFFPCKYSGSSPNGHSHKQTALLTATFTKPHLSQLPYKLCTFTFLYVASSSNRHLFRNLRVSAQESFHLHSIDLSNKIGCHKSCMAVYICGHCPKHNLNNLLVHHINIFSFF